MKKLISVFAALAFVGSMAAAPKKPAAKPVVAAPAAAAPVAAVAASMPKSSGKGMGLFIEGRFGYLLSNGSSSSLVSGDGSTNPTSYQLSNAAGLAYGGTIGYQLMDSLGLVGGFDYRNIKSREWSATNSNSYFQTADPLAVTGGSLAAINAGSTATGSKSTLQNVKNTMILTLGLRPSVKIGPGDFYAGAGAALVLPYDSTTTVAWSNTTGTITSQTVEAKKSFNLAIGAYGEIGYNFNITDNLYIGIGARVLVATSNNDGKNTVITHNYTTGAGTSTAIVTLANSTSVDATAGTSSTSGTTTNINGQNKYESDGTTDITGSVNVGFRF